MIIGFILALMARFRGGVMMHGAFSAFPDTLAQLSWSTFNIDLDVYQLGSRMLGSESQVNVVAGGLALEAVIA